MLLVSGARGIQFNRAIKRIPPRDVELMRKLEASAERNQQSVADRATFDTLTTMRSRKSWIAKRLASAGLLACTVSTEPSTKVTLKIISWPSRLDDPTIN